MDAAFDEKAGHEDSRSALTVLTRLGRRVVAEQRWLRRILERRLSALSEDALYVGMETGSPMPEILAEVVRAAERHERHQAVNLLRVKLPKETANLKTLTVEIRRQAVGFIEDKKTGRGAKRDIALTEALSALALALHDKGQLDEAARAAIEASRHASLAFRSNAEQDRRRLAAVLGNLGNHLRDVCRFEDALKAAEKAEALGGEAARGLHGKLGDVAQQPRPPAMSAASRTRLRRPRRRRATARLGGEAARGLHGRLDDVARQPHLSARSAASRTRLRRPRRRRACGASWRRSSPRPTRQIGRPRSTTSATHLGEIGRFEDALKAAEKAEGLRRELAAKQPEAYTANWATSLVNLSGSLRDVCRFEDALKAAEKAEGLRRELAAKQPEAYTANWATSLVNLSGSLRDVGRFEDALKAAEKAEGLRRDLAAKQPEAYTADWTTSLNNLGNHLGEIGRFEDALKAAEKAEGLRRDLAAKQPEAYTANWATSLVNLGNLLGDVGRFEDALKAAEKAEGLRRELAAKQPEAYTADWATSLVNLGNLLGDVGRFEDALKAAEKAEGLRRDLAAKQPEAYTANWATSLSNLSEAQVSCGRFGAAVEAAKAAISRISQFAARYPAVYSPWLGYGYRLTAEAYFKLQKIKEAAVEAGTAVQIWSGVATTRKNYESVQIAKSFLVLMQRERALDQNDAVLSTFRRAIDLLREPLSINPKPLERTISEMINLARTIDPNAA